MTYDAAAAYNAYAPPRDPTSVVGRRIIAFVIDAFILGVITFIALNASLKSADLEGLPPSFDFCDRVDTAVCWEDEENDTAYLFEEDSDAFIGIGVPILAWVSNLVILQGMTGATIGKFALGLRVVSKNGRNAGVGRALVRSLFLAIDSLCFFIPGLVTMLTTKGHRRIGDLVGGTYVISAQDAASGTVPVADAYAPIGAVPPPVPGWAPPEAAPGGGWTPPPPRDAAPSGSPYNAPPPDPPPSDEPPPPSTPW